jgi:nitrogenase molybdenum-iron protein alpha/beta subunit
MPTEEVDKARREVEDEFEQFRKHLGKILEAVQRVSDAGPLDDIHGLLERLDKAVDEVRTGGMVGSGSKGHREALEKFLKLQAGDS